MSEEEIRKLIRGAEIGAAREAQLGNREFWVWWIARIETAELIIGDYKPGHIGAESRIPFFAATDAETETA